MPDPIISRIPLAIAPFNHLEAFGERFENSRYMPFYQQSGHLWFIYDMETGDDVPPAVPFGPPLPMHMQIDRLAAQRPTHRMVYFIGGAEGPIKIGVTGSIKARLATLQSHSPVRLEVKAARAGGEDIEAAYHAWFAEDRLHGEWFRPSPSILAEIDRLVK